MRTIDLGTYRYHPDGADGAAPEPRPWPRPWRPRPAAVRAGGLGLVAVLALSLAGAAAPAPPPLERLWRVSLAAEQEFLRFATDQQRVYVGSADRSGGRGEPAGTLTAYRLSDGRVEWQRPLRTWNPPGLRLAGGTVLVTTSGPASDGVTTAYDAGTGRPRWSHPAPVHGVLPDRVVMLRPPGSHDRMALRPVDAATGRETGGRLRMKDTGQLVGRQRQDGGTDAFALAPDGTVTRYRLATGETVAAVPTRHVEVLEYSRQNRLSFVDGVLLIASRDAGGATDLSGYDPDTLAHRWDVPHGVTATACGGWLCVSTSGAGSPSPDTIRAIDPATGAPGWTVPCRAVAAGQPCTHVGVQELEPDGRLWVAQRMLGGVPGAPGTPSPVVSWVADAGTGRPLTGPTTWDLARQLSGSELLLVRRVESSGGPEGPAAGHGRPPPDRYWWARADTGLTGIRALGSTGGHHCRPHRTYLLCQRSEQSLTVWRVNS